MLDKPELRARMSRVRRAMTATEVASSSRRIQRRLMGSAVFRSAETFLLYISVGKEVGTHALIRELLRRKKRITVPVFSSSHSDRMQVHEIMDWGEWKPGHFGVPTPTASRCFEGNLDVCIVPGLAFSLRCDRLGFGKGHWDRFFESASVGTIIGLCHDCQVVEELPVEKTDRPADFVLTNQRVLGIRGNTASL